MEQQVQTPPKPIHKSVTFWINVAAIAAVVLKIGVDSGAVTDPDVLAIVIAAVNLINRLRTKVPVTPSL